MERNNNFEDLRINIGTHGQRKTYYTSNDLESDA